MPGMPPESEQLADAFATLARELEAAVGAEEKQASITRFCVEHVPGCSYAAISLLRRRKGRLTAAAATDDIADWITTLQHEVDEGPSLTALTDHNVVSVHDLRDNERWPRFTSRVIAEAAPVASMLSAPLYTSTNTIGALNLYADRPQAFDAYSRIVVTILATHAAIALTAARDHQQTEDLEAALENSRTIGIAIGLVMSAQELPRDRAFNFLVNISQRLNVKLSDIAEVIAEAGGLPDGYGEHNS